MQTELLIDPGHVRSDLQQMTAAVRQSIKNPEIPIPAAVIEAMPKVAGTILLKGNAREQLRAGALLLAFMEFNKSINEPKQPAGQTINVGVNIANGPDDRRQQILSVAERARARIISERVQRIGTG